MLNKKQIYTRRVASVGIHVKFIMSYKKVTLLIEKFARYLISVHVK